MTIRGLPVGPPGSAAPAAVLGSVAALTGAIRLRVGWPAVGAALVFGGLGVWLVTQTDNDGGPVAVVAILAVTSALLLVRSVPLAAAVLVLAGVAAGQLLAGPLVTCGIVLPVTAVLAYRLAARPLRRWPTVLASVLLVGVLVVELLLDPVFGYADGTADASGPVFVGGFELGIVVAGMVSRDRRRTLERLRAKTEELVRQRERTAALAVSADRAQLGVDLDLAVRDELRRLALAARNGRAAAAAGETAITRDAFADVEDRGRAVLAGMRAVVGTLDHPGTEPPPGIDRLSDLVHRATAAEVRLRIDGAVRPIGPHLELSVYRVVEYLLGAAGGQDDRVDVRVTFDRETVGIRVHAPTPRHAGAGADPGEADDPGNTDGWAPLDAARARAEMAGGRFEALTARSGQDIRVVLPIPTALTPVG